MNEQHDFTWLLALLEYNSVSFQQIRETMATKSDVETILNRLDLLAKQLGESNKELLGHDRLFRKIENRLTYHAKRIKALES